MLTAFDVGVAVLLLLSAVLATARGFTREILSLATWAGSAAIAAYAYFKFPEIARSAINEPIVADVVTVVGSFVVSLIILHLITMRIADFVVDSRIGPLDRSLGFIFGIVRGVLIAVVVVIFGNWLLPQNLVAFAKDSKTLPMLESLGDSLVAVLPPDLEKQVTDLIHKRTGADDTGTEEASPDETTAPDAGTAPADDATDGLESDLPQDAAPAAPAAKSGNGA